MLIFLQDRAVDNKCIWPLTHVKLADYHVHPVISWSSHIPLFCRTELLLASQYCSTQYHKYKISHETSAFLFLKTILNQPSQTKGLHFTLKISGVAKKPNEMGDRLFRVGHLTVS